MLWYLAVSHYINKKTSGVLMKGGEEETTWHLKNARKPGNTGILLKIQLVIPNHAIRKLSPNYILYKYVKLHLLRRQLSSYERNKQMIVYWEKCIMCGAVNQAH